MRITKDEARILFISLEEHKYTLNNEYKPIIGDTLYDKLSSLENRLFEHSMDERRTGRTSQDSFSDCLRRFVKK